MSSMVSANSGMVCRELSTALASTARNLLGETWTGAEPEPEPRLSSARQNSMLWSSRLLMVVMVSSATLSDQRGYLSWFCGGHNRQSDTWVWITGEGAQRDSGHAGRRDGRDEGDGQRLRQQPEIQNGL